MGAGEGADEGAGDAEGEAGPPPHEAPNKTGQVHISCVSDPDPLFFPAKDLGLKKNSGSGG